MICPTYIIFYDARKTRQKTLFLPYMEDYKRYRIFSTMRKDIQQPKMDCCEISSRKIFSSLFSFFARRFSYTMAIVVTKGHLLIASAILVFVPYLSVVWHYMPYARCFQRATLAILVQITRISGESLIDS